MSAHVTVVGGGVAGLMVTLKLAVAGYQPTLLEAQPSLGAGSSTHNHGWLHHSGRYYLLTHGLAVVQQCREGAEEILRLAPHCIEPCRGSYLITADADRAHYYAQGCHEVGFSPDEVSVKTLQTREPALRRSPIQAAFAVSDRPFSPSALLQTLYTAAVEAGAEVRCGTVVQEFRLRAGQIVGVRYQYDGSFDEIPTDFVVNSAGAWSRALLLTAGLDVPDIRLFQSSLLVVEPPLAECMLLSLDKLGVTVVPHLHRTVFGVNGDAQPLEVPGDELQTGQASIDILTHAVVDLMPMTSGHKNFAAWVWTCRKTEFVQERNGRGRSPAYAVLDHSAQGIANLLTCLPGKFTAAPAMATAVLTRLRERLPLTRMGIQAMASGIR